MTNRLRLEATFNCSKSIIELAVQNYAASLGSNYTGSEFEIYHCTHEDCYTAVTGEAHAIMCLIGHVSDQGEAGLISARIPD